MDRKNLLAGITAGALVLGGAGVAYGATQGAEGPGARPTVTVTATKKVTTPTTHRIYVQAPPERTGGDERFLQGLANDGIRAPADWALSAGAATCDMSHTEAAAYLEDGGIHPEHVEDFLTLYNDTHGYTCGR